MILIEIIDAHDSEKLTIDIVVEATPLATMAEKRIADAGTEAMRALIAKMSDNVTITDIKKGDR